MLILVDPVKQLILPVDRPGGSNYLLILVDTSVPGKTLMFDNVKPVASYLINLYQY